MFKKVIRKTLNREQFLRSLRETGTDRHQKALYDIYIVSSARYRTGVGAGTKGTNRNIKAPISTYPNMYEAQYRTWIVLTRTNRLEPKNIVKRPNLAQKTAFWVFWADFQGQYLQIYWSKAKNSEWNEFFGQEIKIF